MRGMLRVSTLVFVCVSLGLGSLAQAVGTPVGTPITNTASVTFTVGGTNATVNSNPTSVTVAQILNVVTTVQTPSVIVSPGDANRSMTFRVTNTGNGSDAFVLTPQSTLAGDAFDPVLAVPSIYLDTDNSGTFTAGDTAYVAGSNVTLGADGAVTVFVLNNIPAGLNNGDEGRSQLNAARAGGIGAPGTVFAGQGVGGVDAVVGTTGAQSSQDGRYVVANISLAAVKSQLVTDQYGGARPIPGATIRYTIAVTPSGAGTATNAAFIDVIPANTTFAPASIRLNGTAMTDASGDDAGQYIATPTAQVSVALGNLTQASGVQTIEFSVTIN